MSVRIQEALNALVLASLAYAVICSEEGAMRYSFYDRGLLLGVEGKSTAHNCSREWIVGR